MTTLGDELRNTANSVKGRKQAIKTHFFFLKQHVVLMLKEKALAGDTSLILNFLDLYKSTKGIEGLIAQDFRKNIEAYHSDDRATGILNSPEPTIDEQRQLVTFLSEAFNNEDISCDIKGCSNACVLVIDWMHSKKKNEAANTGCTGMMAGCTGPTGSCIIGTK